MDPPDALLPCDLVTSGDPCLINGEPNGPGDADVFGIGLGLKFVNILAADVGLDGG